MVKGLGLVVAGGVADWGGELMRPLKSRGVARGSATWGPRLARLTVGRLRDFPQIPSSSLAELELVEPSGEVVGGGEERAEETGEEVVVEGERVTLLSISSRGRTETPSSTTVCPARIGLKILFLLLAK